MKKCLKKSNRITVSLTQVDHDKLEALADSQDVSMSWVVRKAVSEYLEKNSVLMDGRQVRHIPVTS